jgi:2-polyprenyl-3-methyl-5-hydroxy-6-metoxy-1,4-benzoquinol methylase
LDSKWPDLGLENAPYCPVCGSNKRKILYENLTDQVFFCAPGTWCLHECNDCRCAYLDPRPSSDTIHLAYQKYYTHKPPEKNGLETMGFLRRTRRSMANGYTNWRYGTKFQPANSLGIVVAFIYLSLRHRLDRRARNLPRTKPNARLLDIGFGSGAFLEFAKNAGWDVAGVDPDPVAVDSAIKRGLNVRPGGVEAFADMPESFDVVTMNHVIEHVHDPCKTLQSIYHLLKPGGCLWLSTPNIQSFGHEYYGKNWRGLEPPRHLILFNWQAISELLRNTGFKSVQSNNNNFNFANLAAKSETLSKGLDPYSFSKVNLRHRVKGILVGIRTRFQPYRTEFITLKAYKP